MDSILEDQRRLHEERERLIDVQTNELLRKKATNREQINSDHIIKVLWNKYIDGTNQLISLYEDKEGMRKKEIQSLSGHYEYNEFNSRLKSIIHYHKKNPFLDSSNLNVPLSVEYDNLVASIKETDEELVNFTDEEGYGKYLDLNELYQKYVNIKGVEKINYIQYLSEYDHLFKIPREKKNNDYKNYLNALYDYLYIYLERIKPLLNIQREIVTAVVEFEKKWKEGLFQGWPKETSGALTKSGAYLDLSGYSSWAELSSLGLDRLKSALMALGLKCGGSLEERAIRLFQTKGKRLQDLDPSLFAKTQKGSKNSVKEYTEKHKEIAEFEAKIYSLAEIIGSNRNATIENVQRKQARTGDEREEDEEDIVNENESDEDDEEVVYNPKNLPLGWDGKPIPYWLYKLHGLNLYFNCEICGNHKYRGPKAYQRHFSEWRHAHGMRCLGIPNTSHFANIVLIEDAVQLWEKLKLNRDHERFKPENEEEFEDSIGNVLNKKTHDDLKRQGLL